MVRFYSLYYANKSCELPRGRPRALYFQWSTPKLLSSRLYKAGKKLEEGKSVTQNMDVHFIHFSCGWVQGR